MDEVVIIKNSKAALFSAFAAGAVIGGFAAASFVRKAMQEEMAEQIEVEFEKLRVQYGANSMTKPWSTPQEAVKDLHPGVDPLKDQSFSEALGKVFEDPNGKREPVAYDKIRTFDPGDAAPEEVVDETGPVTPPEVVEETEDIYVITEEVYQAAEKGHIQESLWYYPVDGVVADTRDNKVENPSKFLGRGFAMRFGVGTDPNIVYVRNETLQIDYEIALAKDQSWARDVAGIEDPESAFEQTDRQRINGE